MSGLLGDGEFGLYDSSSSVNWGGEDWGSLANDERDHKHTRKTNKKVEEEEEEEGLLGGGDFGSYDSSKAKVPVLPGGATSEVKIKMTKKQLEELMGRVELKQMTVQQVLAQLIISVSTSTTTAPYEATDHHRPWRPVLQSIPEVN